MTNTWQKQQPSTVQFNDARHNDDGTTTQLSAIFSDTGSGEWQVELKKDGTSKGIIKMDSLSDFKDFFSQVGAAL